MKREDIEKLLGGYATGTLTLEEREALFAAALEDQQLFDALAEEEPLRELLQDPVARTRLLAGLEQTPPPWYRRWLRPAAWAVPAAGLAAIAVWMVVQRPASQQPVTIAQVRPLRQMEPVAPVPSPLPDKLAKRDLPQLARVIHAEPAETNEKGTAPTPLVQPLSAPPPPPPPAPVPAPSGPAQPADKAAEHAVPSSTAEQIQVQALPVQPLPVQPSASRKGLQAGPQSASGIRFQAVSGVGGAVPPADVRALYFGAPIPPVFQTNLVDAEKKQTPLRAAQEVVAVDALKPASINLGLRYTVLRKPAGAESGPVTPKEALDEKDEFAVRFEPNDGGYLSVFEQASDGSWKPLTARRVERMMPYTVPASGWLRFGDSRSEELFVVFSREPLKTPYPVPEARLDQLIDGSPAEQTTYVVSVSAAASTQTLAFPITLTHK